MVTFANILPNATTDGTVYASGFVLPSVEGDLFNGTVLPDPVPVKWHETIVAIVRLAITGGTGTNSSYVVLQGDLGDGVFVDLAWFPWTGTTGSVTFVLSAGTLSSAAPFQQTRSSGSAPASSGTNACPLPGRIRFVGKASLAGGSSSSSSPGVQSQVTCTITYKLGPLR